MLVVAAFIDYAQYHEALAVLAIALLNSYPSNFLIWTLKAYAHLGLHDNEVAVAAADRGIEFEPEFAYLWLIRAGALMELEAV